MVTGTSKGALVTDLIVLHLDKDVEMDAASSNVSKKLKVQIFTQNLRILNTGNWDLE